MNLLETFVTYISTINGSTLGQNLFIGGAPSSNKVPDEIWWVIETGGNRASSFSTGESIQDHQFSIYHRGLDYETVRNDLEILSSGLDCSGCISLEGYEVLDTIVTSYPVDNDIDSEDRKVGLIQVNLKIYKECS